MSDSFSQAYEALAAFVRANPEIELREFVTSIPESVRPEFYRRFNAARTAFVAQKFPGLLEKALELQQKHAEAEQNLSGLVSWEETSETSPVRRFLRSVPDGMARELFDPLFDLLKGRETIEGFERIGAAGIAANWPALYQGGYERWTVLTLVKLLEPDKVLRVDVRPLSQGERAKSSAYAPWDDVPVPREASSLYFTQPRNAVLAAPDLIIRSAMLHRFVGIRTGFRDGLCKGLNPSQQREWLPLDSELLSLLESGLTLVYVAEEPQQIAMVADVNRFCRPDLILWCINTQKVEKTEALDMMNLIDRRIAPRNGSIGILTAPWEEPVESAMGARFLEVGFDSSRLKEVLALLADAAAPEIT